MENTITKPLEKILIGDDQAWELKSILSRQFPKIQMEFAETPEQAIAMASASKYDAVITDLNYTDNGQEGYNVLSALKGKYNVLVLWTSDAYKPGVLEKALSLGATHVLDKCELGKILNNCKEVN